jgi:hypothetical protein
MRAFVVVLCLLTATACGEKSAAGPTRPLNERFTLGRGDTETIEAADLRVQFSDVTGDSRCPADVFCIQGGDAIVQIRVSGGHASAGYELHTGDSSRAAATHQQVRIELVELQPYPFSSRTIAPDDYRATFVLTRP